MTTTPDDAARAPAPDPTSPVAPGDVAAPERGLHVLARATDALRLHTPSGWRALRADLLDHARRVYRPSAPLRARHPGGEYVVAGDVLVARVRAALAAVPGVEVTAVRCTTNAQDRLDVLTVQIAVVFGTPVLAVAGTVLDLTATAVEGLLGPVGAEGPAPRVHVHVGDVTRARL
ncbi:hypothetical protein [Kineococcus radiotolerans]|uniref:Uncharacterized protein n=1 Tax=Kineococcus radiotolerans (strain ATCC BAA-149 / DSM 14245 / SRS30216) TaxID=266940 RepID=A6W8E4_KINRD|nr:hypothetical protein [Kineococcus radiotolerans]ABS03083.1 hypothetical protein Krad_1597 [Kineococcus radiotolerans SRS30216 = ATCC BAA-149]